MCNHSPHLDWIVRFTGKKTEDGLPIYDTSELKIGLGGGAVFPVFHSSSALLVEC